MVIVLAVAGALALASPGRIEKVRELSLVVRLTPQHLPGALAASVEFVAAAGPDSPTPWVSW